MHLPGAFRCLPRPSSAPEPSHPPNGVTCRIYSETQHSLMFKLLHGNNREFSSKISLCPSLDESAHELHLVYGPSKPFALSTAFLRR
jgi:hypothetical protein